MKKRVQKIIGIMLVVIASCFCGLTGCKGKYDDMTLDVNTNSIELFLGETDNEGNAINNTAEFTATVGGVGDDVSKELTQPALSTSGVISVETTSFDEVSGRTTFLVSANDVSTEPVIVTVRTKEGGKTATVNVTVIRRITGMSPNAGAKQDLFAVVGETKNINTISAITFEPENTNQKDGVWTISNKNGHEATITENGDLLVTKKNGVNPLELTFTSSVNGIAPVKINVQVVEPIHTEDIKLMLDEDTEIGSFYKWQVLDLNDSDMRLQTIINTTEDYTLSVSVDGEPKVVNASKETENLIDYILLNTTGNTGTSTLKVTVTLNGYNYSTSKDIQIQVARLPKEIKVNGEDLTNTSKTYDIYDKYQNNLGQRFAVEIDPDATDRLFTLTASEEHRNQLVAVLQDGTAIRLDGTQTFNSGTIFYIKAVADYDETIQPSLVISTINDDKYNIISGVLNFALRTSAQSVKIEAYGEKESMLFIEKGTQIELKYNLDSEKAFVGEIFVTGYDEELIDVKVEEVVGELPRIFVTAKNVNLSSNVTSLRLQLANGIESQTVNIYVYTPANSVRITAPRETDTQYGKYIANAVYDNGNLKDLVVARGGIVKLNVNAKTDRNQDATIFSQNFILVEENDRTFLNVDDKGTIGARMVKEVNEGVIKVKAIISTLVANGENGDAKIETNEFEINVSIFVQITSINLDTQFTKLYYKNNLWYENNQLSKLNEKSLNLKLEPQNATADRIEWQLSNSDSLEITPSTENKSCLVTALETGNNKQVALTVFVYQKNRVFSKTCYIEVAQVVEPNKIVIEGVNKNGTLVELPDGDKKINVGGGLTATAKDLYIDVRNITADTKMQIKAYVPEYVNNNKVTNTNVCYEINYGDAVTIDANGNIRFIEDGGTFRSGTVQIKVYAQGSRTLRNPNISVVEYILLTIANGESEQTAFRVANENDFNQMLSDKNIENHYYKLTSNIYLKNDFSSLSLPSNFAPRKLSGQGYTIYGLNINRVREPSLEENENNPNYNYISLFGQNSGIIENINFELSINIDLKNIEKPILISGLVANNQSIISDVSVTIKEVNISNLQNNQIIYFGGISAKNSGTITNSIVNGDIAIDQTVNLDSLYLGGLVGENNGTIKSDNDNYATQKGVYLVNFNGEITLNNVFATNSYIGGVAGYNLGTISNMRVENALIQANFLNNVGGLVGLSTDKLENNYVNASVEGKENVGGLAGQVQGASVLQNIVELYENDRIVGKTDAAINAISGDNNVGGLVGFVCDTNSALTNASNISNNYIKNYLSKLYIYSENIAGGLIGNVDGATIDNVKTIVQISFANVNTKANTSGGLIGKASNCSVTNVYSRGKVEGLEGQTNTLGELVANVSDTTLENAYSTISLDTKTSNGSSVYYDKTASELNKIFKSSPWANATQNSITYNDGYPILMMDDIVMEKNVPTSIVLEKGEGKVEDDKNIIVTEDTTNGIVVRTIIDNKIDIGSLLFIKDESNNTISPNDLIIKSSNEEVFVIENNRINAKFFGTAEIIVYSKYDRNVYSSKKITLVHDVTSLEIHDKNSENSDSIKGLKLQVNKNQYVYPFIKDVNSNIISSETLFVKVTVLASEYENTNKTFKINNQEFVSATTIEENGTQTTYYYAYIPYSQMLINALEKTTANLSLSVVEKVGDKYYELTQAQEFTLDIFEGIKSISIDKQEVNLTTMNEVNFIVTVIADIDSDALFNEYSETENDNNGKIFINYKEDSKLSDTQDLILVRTNDSSYSDGIYTHTLNYTLRMRDEYLLLNSQNNKERKELKEGFSTALTFGFDKGISSLTAQIQITVEPQELLKIDALHFPNGLTTTTGEGSDKKEIFNANELPSNTITPGEFGLLMVDIYPEYAYFDEIEVYYTTDSDSTMTFVQVALASITDDISRYVEVKPNALIQNQKIIMSRISTVTFNGDVVNDDETKFTGRYYVKTLIPTKTPAGTKYNVVVRATTYVKKENGEIEKIILESTPLTIEALPRPSVDLTTDAEDVQISGDTIYIARGTTQTITAQTSNYSKFADFTVNGSFNEQSLIDYYTENNMTGDIYTLPSLSTSGNTRTLYVPLAVPSGTEIVVTATVSRFINGIEIQEKASVKFVVVDYVINGLQVKDGENTINVVQGQTKTISLELKTQRATENTNQEVLNAQTNIDNAERIIAIYNQLTKNDENEKVIKEQEVIVTKYEAIKKQLIEIIETISNEIIKKNEEISKLYDDVANKTINPIWQWEENGTTSDISGKVGEISNPAVGSPFQHITIKQYDNTKPNSLVVQGKKTNENAITNLFAEYKFKYKFVNNKMEVVRDDDKDSNVKTFVKCYPIQIYVTTSATVDKPHPIYTMDEFLGMADGDYILMNNLYFTTQDEYFSQSYSEKIDDATKKLNDTDYDYYYYDSNTRFTSITPKFKSLDGNGYKIYINSFALDQNSNSNYGFFSKIDKDIMVRNLEIVFLNQVVNTAEENATPIYNIRDNYTISTENVTKANFGIFVGQNEGIITNCNVTYYQIGRIEKNEDGNVTKLFDMQQVASQNFTLEIDSSVDAVIGGFVGVNNGYITNSKIGGVEFANDSKGSVDFDKVLTIKGNGKIGGFVGSNNFKISSCYAHNIGVINSSPLIKGTQTAGFVAENTTKGKIIQSFAEGMTTKDGENNKIIKYYDAKKMNNIIASNGYIGGFVHSNYGVINDSYANVPIETPARSAGFVYLTSGKDAVISECFALSKSRNQEDTTAFRFFTGTDDMTKVNVLEDAKIKNCYYESETVPVEIDEKFREPATAVSSKDFKDFDKFYGFEQSIWGENSKDVNKNHLILSTTEQTTFSRRIISGINYVEGVITDYTYSYSSDSVGSSTNPLIVYNDASFLQAFNGGELKSYTQEDGKKVYLYNKGFIRLVTDISLENYLGHDELKQLQSVVFAGSLDGNGLEITNVGVLGTNETESFGLFKQIGLISAENSAIIKNLTIQVVEVAKSTSTMVGALAGRMEKASLVNTHIIGDGITIEGKNIVGGVIGYVGKDSKLSNVSANVSVISAYAQKTNNKEYADFTDITLYDKNSKDKNLTKVSYSGGIVGVLDSGTVDLKNADGTYKQLSKLQLSNQQSSRLYAYGDITISGEIVGGIVGYNGMGSSLHNSKFEIANNNNQLLVGKYSVGGLVGENHGSISASRIEVIDENVDDVDETFNNETTMTLFSSDSTYPRYVAGLVGFMPEGKIDNSFSKANIIHPNARFIAGLVASLGKNEPNAYFSSIEKDEDINEFKNGLGKRDMLFDFLGAGIRYAYSTGVVWTNPDYRYTVENTTTTIYESDLTNGTIIDDIYATPQNYVGGMIGELIISSTEIGKEESKERYMLTNVLKDNVSIVNWRDSINGFDNILRAMNGDHNNRKDELDKNITNLDGSQSKVIYNPNTGYFAGKINITNEDANKTIQNMLLSDQYCDSLYLNNFINNGTNKIAQQVVLLNGNKVSTYADNNTTSNKFAVDGDLGLKFHYNSSFASDDLKKLSAITNQNDDEDIDYSEITINLRNEYRETVAKAHYFYANFSENYWTKEGYTYPKLLDKQANSVVRIYDEKDLEQLTNTSSVITTYYLMNDIALTKNWEPVKGFKGIFMSGDGGPYTIYNINIKSENQDSVGFFASTQNAIISNINFVFGGKFDPERDASGNIVFGKDSNGNSTGKFVLSKGKILTNWGLDSQGNPVSVANSDYTNGIVASFKSQTQTNLSAFIGENHSSTILNVGLNFANGATISATYESESTLQDGININFGLISAQTVVNAGDSCQIYGITLRQQTGIGETGIKDSTGKYLINGEGDLQTTFTFKPINVKNLNVAGLFGNINNNLQTKISISNINSNIPVKLKTVGAITLQPTDVSVTKSNNELTFAGAVGKVNNVSFDNTNLSNGGSITFGANLSTTSNASDSYNIYAGAIIGKAESVNIKDCQVSQPQVKNEQGKITQEALTLKLLKTSTSTNINGYVGGLVGYANSVTTQYNQGSMIYANLNISSLKANKFAIGGIVGEAVTSTLNKVECETNIDVKPNNFTNVYLGGFVGYTHKGSSYELCISSGNISVDEFNNTSNTNTYIGGFAGLVDDSNGNIKNCFALTNIDVANVISSTTAYVGGFVGLYNNSEKSLTNCISMGYVNATVTQGSTDHFIGGFVGKFSGTINYNTSFTTLFTRNYITSSFNNVGGFVGSIGNGNQGNNYYAYQLAGVADNGIGIKMGISTHKQTINAVTSDVYYVVDKDGTGVVAKDYINSIKKSSFKNSVLLPSMTEEGSKINPHLIAVKDFNSNDNFTFISGENYHICSSASRIDKNYQATTNKIDIPENVTIIGCSTDTLNTATFVNKVFNSIGKNSLVSGLNINYNNENSVSIDFAGFVNTNNGSIFECYVTGNVKVVEDIDSISGFVGENKGTISNSSSTLKMDINNKAVTNSIAGFVTKNSGLITFSYTNGEINNVATRQEQKTGDKKPQDYPIISGFAIKNSYDDSLIANSYSATVCIDINSNSSGFVYDAYQENLLNCYYDKFAFNGKVNVTDYVKTTFYFLDTIGTNETFAKENSTSQDKSSDIFSKVWTYDSEYNYGYPILKNINGEVNTHTVLSTGNGNSDKKPYLINHGGKLDWIRTVEIGNGSQNYFKQVHDIDMSAFGEEFTTISDLNNSSFGFKASRNNKDVKDGDIVIGNFQYMNYNGDKHVIDNIIIDGSKINNQTFNNQSKKIVCLGLFANANKIENLGIDIEIKNASQQIVGGLVAYIQPWAIISNCFVNVQMNIIDINEQVYTGTKRLVGGVVAGSTGFAGDGNLKSSFAIGEINYTSDTLSLNTTIGGISGTKVDVANDKSIYSAVSIKTIRQFKNLTLISATNSYNSGKAQVIYYDENISLCNSKNDHTTNISFADNWLQDENNLKNKLDGDWKYSKYNYPVQSWVKNNKYAVKLLGYQTDENATNGTGSKISPYQITNITTWKENQPQYDNVVVMKDACEFINTKGSKYIKGTKYYEYNDRLKSYFIMTKIPKQDSNGNIIANNIYTLTKPSQTIIIKNTLFFNGNNCNIESIRNAKKDVIEVNQDASLVISGIQYNGNNNVKFAENLPRGTYVYNVEATVSNSDISAVIMDTVNGVTFNNVRAIINNSNITVSGGILFNTIKGNSNINNCYVQFSQNQKITSALSGGKNYIGFIAKEAYDSSISNCYYTSINSSAISIQSNLKDEFRFGTIIAKGETSVISNINLEDSPKLTITSQSSHHFIGVVAGTLSECQIIDIVIGSCQQEMTINGTKIFQSTSFNRNSYAELTVSMPNNSRFSYIGSIAGAIKGTNKASGNFKISNNIDVTGKQTFYLGGVFGAIYDGDIYNFSNITRNNAIIHGKVESDWAPIWYTINRIDYSIIFKRDNHTHLSYISVSYGGRLVNIPYKSTLNNVAYVGGFAGTFINNSGDFDISSGFNISKNINELAEYVQKKNFKIYLPIFDQKYGEKYQSYGTTRSFFNISNDTTKLEYNTAIGLYSENDSGNTGLAYQHYTPTTNEEVAISTYYAHNFIPFDDGTDLYRDQYDYSNKITKRIVTAYECWPNTSW